MDTQSPHLRIPHLADDLGRVETELSASVETGDPFLTEVASHLIRAGGKRMRPAFALAAWASGRPEAAPAADEAVMGGVSVELVHLGSLYHDDVMDDATTRRTVESVNARWGNLKAILAGDLLLARASEIAARLGVEIAELLAATIGRLCEGQIRELKDMYNTDRTLEDYTGSINGKTAALFATACRVGALVGEQSEDRVEVLTVFGQQYGMAFQVVDDILDLVATDEQLGKPSGHDLVEGVYTLPVLETLDGSGGDELRSILGKPLDADEREAARAIVRDNGAIPAAIAEAQRYVATAVGALDSLEPSAAVDGMAGTAQHLIARVSAVSTVTPG